MYIIDLFIKNEIFHICLLAIILFAAALSDIKTMKIPNRLILIGLVLGFLYMPSIKGILFKLLYLGILFIFGMFGMLGYGDIKLWMVIAVFLGLFQSTIIIIIAAIISMIYSLFKWRKTTITHFLNFWWQMRIYKDYQGSSEIYIPFAPFMLVSFLLFFLIKEVMLIA